MFPYYRSMDYQRTFDMPLFSSGEMWLVTVVAGVVNGVVRGAIRDGAHVLFDWRVTAMKKVGEAYSLWLSFVVFLGLSLPLILLAALLVMAEPLTAGTGTADVAAALNAIHVPRFFTLRTAIIKFFSTLLTSASGLIWVGPESSMSHLGGATNLLVAKAVKRFLNKFTTKNCGNPKTFSDAECLDLIGTGMGMGIGAAFRTTLAGIIYMAEGVAPLWRPSAFWRALIGSAVAVYIAKLIDEYFICTGVNKVICVSTGGYIAYPLKYGYSLDLLTLVAILSTCVFCGLSGGFFAGISGCLGKHILPYISEEFKLRRVLLALLGMTLTCLAIMSIVILTPCRSLPSTLEAGNNKFLYNSDNLCQPGLYNPAAVILLAHKEYAVQFLYNDNIYLEYWLLISCWLLVYGLAVPFVYAALPVGFLTPNLLSGALVGRFFAQAIGCQSPGVVAVCGSAASLASYFRFPLTSSVFMIQMVTAGRLYMAIIGSVIISHAVAYPISPSLMEIIMRIKRIPYLPRLHRSLVEFFRSRPVAEFMTEQVVSLEKVENKTRLLHVLQSTEFSGFPLLNNSGRVLAVISREEVIARLQSTEPQLIEVNLATNLHPSFNAFNVDANHDFLRCYRLFRHLGLRHMVVVDFKTKTLSGIVTRGDLVKAITAVPKPHYYYITM